VDLVDAATRPGPHSQARKRVSRPPQDGGWRYVLLAGWGSKAMTGDRRGARTEEDGRRAGARSSGPRPQRGARGVHPERPQTARRATGDRPRFGVASGGGCGGAGRDSRHRGRGIRVVRALLPRLRAGRRQRAVGAAMDGRRGMDGGGRARGSVGSESARRVAEAARGIEVREASGPRGTRVGPHRGGGLCARGVGMPARPCSPSPTRGCRAGGRNEAGRRGGLGFRARRGLAAHGARVGFGGGAPVARGGVRTWQYLRRHPVYRKACLRSWRGPGLPEGGPFPIRMPSGRKFTSGPHGDGSGFES